MLVEGIKSRPVYEGLFADAYAKNHVMACDREGAQAIIDLFARSQADIQGTVTIVHAAVGVDNPQRLEALHALPVEIVHVMPTTLTAVQRLKAVLSVARMGTRIYAAGSETMIGLTVQLAQASGIDAAAVYTEHRGTMARRVQCVHCKGFTENVTTNIVTCAHCQTNLLVRDHYSRRLAAFQGVCVDAEVPGELPEIEEVFK